MRVTKKQKSNIKLIANGLHKSNTENKIQSRSNIVRDSLIEAETKYISKTQNMPPMTPEMNGNSEVAQSACI